MIGSIPSDETSAAEEPAKTCAVIGAGLIGVAIAWELRLAGFAVTLYDPAPGADASYAAAGMLAPVTETQYGQEALWELMAAARDDYPEFIAGLDRAGATATGYRDTPTLLVAADRGDHAAVADLVSIQQRFGMEVSPLNGSALRRREPALNPGLAKSWEVPQDHQIDPRALHSSMLAILTAPLDSADFPETGPTATLKFGRVDEVRPKPLDNAAADCRYQLHWSEWSPDRDESGLHQSEVDETEDTATQKTDTYDAVVVSAGMGYQQIAGIPDELPLPLRRVFGEVLRLRVRPEQLTAGESQLISSVIRAKVAARSVYLVPRADGEIVIGASSREDDVAETSAGSVAELLADAITVLPSVREMSIEEITTRARPGTPDDRPYLGALSADGRVIVATGFFRHGVLLAPQAARLSKALLQQAFPPDQVFAQETDRDLGAGNDARAGSDHTTGAGAGSLSADDRRLLAITDPYRHQRTP